MLDVRIHGAHQLVQAYHNSSTVWGGCKLGGGFVGVGSGGALLPNFNSDASKQHSCGARLQVDSPPNDVGPCGKPSN
jgi:hypothetical protein